MPAAFHRPRIDGGEAHPASGHLGLLVPFIPRPRQRAAHQRLDQAEPLVAAQIRQQASRLDTCRFQKGAGQTLGQLGAQRGGHRSGSTGAQRPLPLRGAEACPANVQSGRRCSCGAGAHGDVRDIEHRRSAVAAVREQEAARGRRLPPFGASGQRDRQRHTGEIREGGRLRGQRRERRVGRMHVVTESLDELQAEPVASGLRDGETAGRHDHGIRLQRRPAAPVDAPARPGRRKPGDQRPHQQAHAVADGQRQQSVSHVAGAVRRGKELRRFRLLDEPESNLLLEEGDLLRQRPGAQHLAQEVG